MKTQKDYYKLSSDKTMGDNSVIPKGQEITLIEEDGNDGMMFFETYINGHKKKFWLKKEDVECFSF